MRQTPSSLFGFLPLASALLTVPGSIRAGHTPRPRYAAPDKAQAKAARIRALQRKARRTQRQAAR